jgi:CRP/FNR family transcriptional regulator, anaerobic regulatory protein
MMLDVNRLRVACQLCRLSELCLPRGLDKNEVEMLDSIITRGRPLQRGEYLYRPGDKLTGLFVVRSGSLRSYASAAGGGEQTVGFYLPGELVGLDGLEHDRYTCSAIALETTTVCELPITRLGELCGTLPSLHKQMLRLVGKEVSSDHETLLMLGSQNAEQRLATFLLSLSERFSKRGFSATEFKLSMSRNDIADFLGIAVETVSRQFSSFQRQGIIRVSQRFVQILDPARLRARIADPCARDSSVCG